MVSKSRKKTVTQKWKHNHKSAHSSDSIIPYPGKITKFHSFVSQTQKTTATIFHVLLLSAEASKRVWLSFNRTSNRAEGQNQASGQASVGRILHPCIQAFWKVVPGAQFVQPRFHFYCRGEKGLHSERKATENQEEKQVILSNFRGKFVEKYLFKDFWRDVILKM